MSDAGQQVFGQLIRPLLTYIKLGTPVHAGAVISPVKFAGMQSTSYAVNRERREGD